MRCAFLAAALAAGLAEARAPAELYAALERSDTTAVFAFVEDYYRDAGISVNDALVWNVQPFDQVVNWYDQYAVEITVSALSRPDEAARYWDNWSALLTQGRWNWRGFFSGDAEALLLANFNQLMLAAHEYGHALTYRYDWEHEARGGFEVNCREYPADRLAAALVDELAEKYGRFAALRSRYVALMAAINAEIAPESRYDPPGFEALEADCRVMHVVQPTAETMTPYASAFFARQGVLMTRDLPPLKDIYATYLFPHWRALLPPASGAAGTVETLRVYPQGSLTARQTGMRWEGRLPAFGRDGRLYALEYGVSDDGERLRVRFAFGEAGGALEEVVGETALDIGWAKGTDRFSVIAALALGPDHVLALSSGDVFVQPRTWLVDLRRVDGAWSMTAREASAAPADRAALVFDGAGDVHLLIQEVPAGDAARIWRHLAYDVATGGLDERPAIADTPGAIVALGADGLVYAYDAHSFLVTKAGAAPSLLAGDMLQGFKDSADPRAAEFRTGSTVAIPLAEGLRMVDFSPGDDSLVIRRIAPASR